MQVHGNPLRGLRHGWKRNPPRLQRLCNIIICDDKVISSKPNNLPKAACGVFCDFFIYFFSRSTQRPPTVSPAGVREAEGLHADPGVQRGEGQSWRSPHMLLRAHLQEAQHLNVPAGGGGGGAGGLSRWPTGACVCSSSIRRFNKTIFVHGGRAGGLVGAEEQGNT